jgi:hypothetical protein
LETTVAEQTERQTLAASVLEEAHARTKTRDIARPQYVVPDTNCFLNDLPALKRLVNADLGPATVTVVVPIIVVNELYVAASPYTSLAAC